MTKLEILQKAARIKWGTEVGPKSTQRVQEEVLCSLITFAFQEGIDAAIESLPKKKHIPLQKYDYDEIPDEKLSAHATEWRIAGENMAIHESRTRLEVLRNGL